jgi:hypothetical protein
MDIDGDGRIDEAAGIDDDEISVGIIWRDGVSLGAQAREDLLGVDQCLRAAQGHESNPWFCAFLLSHE